VTLTLVMVNVELAFTPIVNMRLLVPRVGTGAISSVPAMGEVVRVALPLKSFCPVRIMVVVPVDPETIVTWVGLGDMTKS